MPVKLNNRCKICNLIKVDENLWVEVHNKVIEEKLPNSVVCKWLNSRVDVLNANLDTPLALKFNNANFTNHFKNHISSLDEMKLELKKTTLKSKDETIAFDEKQKALAGSPIPEKDSYQKISGFVDIMEENLIAYSDNIKERRSSGNNTISERQIMNYSKFVSDLLTAKQNLSKFRNSEQATMMAVSSAIEYIVQGLATKIVGIADDIKSTLEVELKEETSLPDQISKSIKARFSGEMRSLVDETINLVKKNYGLK